MILAGIFYLYFNNYRNYGAPVQSKLTYSKKNLMDCISA